MIRRLLVTLALTATSFTLLLTGCKSGPQPITLSGAGSTFAYPLYSAYAIERLQP